MIGLFVSDIDGCLAEPYQPFDLEGFKTLRDYAASPDETVPAFSLCSGRSYAYVEAMTQALGLTVPVLFESGGGMFDPIAAQLIWNPGFTTDVEVQLQAVRHYMAQTCLPDTAMSLDYGKRTQAGLVGPHEHEIMEALPGVQDFVTSQGMALHVFHTPYSIDVVAPGLTKRQAMDWLGDHLGYSLQEMAFIGDTNGDLEAILAVGYGFAPANAAQAIREQVDQVTEGHLVRGVIEAYRWCIAQNEATRSLTMQQPLDSLA